MSPSSSSQPTTALVLPASQVTHHPGWSQWFYNLPIGNKQLIALVACEFVPIIGFGVGSTLVLQNSLRTQLLAQATSEVAVTETNYTIKINQMGFGGRGQSDNPAIVAAIKRHQRNENTPPNVYTQLKQILQNEVKARKIEYATLIGKDLRIVANANANRTKENLTTPNLAALVQQSITEGKQIKASEVINREELNKEGAPLPDGFAQRDALIRYVITPVRDSERQEDILGVLVFGDLVDRKLSIVENTITAFDGGYSAVYTQLPSGEFSLSTSLNKPTDASPQFGLTLSNPAVLKAAAAAKGATVTDRVQVGGQTYTIAAKALPNRIIETPDRSNPVFSDRPAAILVRGTPEDPLNQLMLSSFQQQAIVLILSLAVIVAWSVVFRRLVLQPIKHLKTVTEEFSAGDRAMRATVSSKDEVGQLAIAFNEMAERLTTSERALAEEAMRQEQQAKEARALSEITARMRRSLSSAQILQTAITEIRSRFKLDRVMIYQFNQDSIDGEVIAEAVSQTEFRVNGKQVSDLLGLGQLGLYTNRLCWSVNDIEQAEISDRYRQNLVDLGVKSDVTVPLKRNNQLVGLLCAQHCTSARPWKDSEIGFLTQMTTQIGYALDQSQLLQERQDALQDAETFKETLQQQITQLLADIQGVAQGDLTVRANTTGELGAVADSLNTIVESLHQLVIQVKQSALQVNALLSQNEDAMQHLATETHQQVEQTKQSLGSVEQMTDALQAVADQARKGTTIAQTASEAAQAGEALMDTAVTSIYSLRATIGDATQKVKQLGESSQQIGRIVSMINDLAVQTDLLAINANIEASRAGDQGRGFGLVASEIGELAARSSGATREIATMIEMIQEQTNQVVEVMNHCATQVVEGSHLARNAKQNLMFVLEVTHQIDELVKSISTTMNAHTHTSRSLTGLMKGINEISSRTSDSSHRVADALRQTVNVAEELKASVGKFKVQENIVRSSVDR
jgi:twitching motility protein PilJ